MPAKLSPKLIGLIVCSTALTIFLAVAAALAFHAISDTPTESQRGKSGVNTTARKGSEPVGKSPAARQRSN